MNNTQWLLICLLFAGFGFIAGACFSEKIVYGEAVERGYGKYLGNQFRWNINDTPN